MRHGRKGIRAEDISLVPEDSSVGTEAETILAAGSLKRRRDGSVDDGMKRVKLKLCAHVDPNLLGIMLTNI